MILGDIMAPYANAKGYRTKAQLAKAAGISAATVYSLWNRTEKVTWIQNAVKLAAALDMPLDLIYEEQTGGRRKHGQVDPEKHSAKIKQGATLCWDCDNAAPDLNGHGCEWSRKFEPVPGWEADEDPNLKSYHVNYCPKFRRDEPAQE